MTGQKMYYVEKLHQKYGPVLRITPTEAFVLDLPSVKEVHAIPTRYPKDVWYQQFTGRSKGSLNMFATTDIKAASHRRRLMGKSLTETEAKKAIPLVEELAGKAIMKMKIQQKELGHFDLYKWSAFVTTDVMANLVFGTSFNMVERGRPNDYIEQIQIAGKLGIYRFLPMMGFTFAMLDKFAPNVFPNPITTFKAVAQYAAQYVNEHQARLEAGNASPTIFDGVAGEKSELTTAEKVSEAQSFMIAGTDTTATTFTYAIWQLSKKPKIVKKLQEEMASLNWDTEAIYTDGHYFQAFMSELLRLYGAAPGRLPRVTPPEGSTFHGLYIPGNTTISTQAWSLHTNPDIYEDPFEFKPERWTAATKQMKDALMPWGGGARICAGQHIAKLELRVLLTRFLQHFDSFESLTSDKDMIPRDWFGISPAGSQCLIRETSA